MIRQAQTKDIPQILKLFCDLLGYLKKNGHDYFSTDGDQYIGGIIEYLVLKLNTQGHIVLVNEIEGEAKAMLIGVLERYPGFHKHRIVGVLEHVYPLTFSSTPLAEAFYDWVKKNDGTSVMCIASSQQPKLLSMYERQGFEMRHTVMHKEI